MATITLNKIAAQITDALDKPFDVMLNERIKDAIIYWRAELIRQDGDRNVLSKEFIQRIVVNLEKVDKLDSCVVKAGCPALRTKEKIPRPIRPKDAPSLFKFVGSADGHIPYTYTDLEELRYTRANKYTYNAIRYNYVNGYIYVFNETKVKYATIEGIFLDPRLASVNCVENSCMTDDDEFPISGDMIRTIVEGIKEGTRRLPETEDKEVPINQEEDGGRR